jgi:predicted site-specific integrase-resolvase
MALKITLTAWAAQEFEPPPAERTLRLWVKEGRIVPAPIKVGRTYYVQPNAQHIAEASRPARLAARLQSA